MQKKIALIDGYGFVFRAYHSLPPLTRPDGTPVGAVYGFTGMLIKLLAGLDVTHAAVVFDSGSKTFRNEIYPDYKANRPPCPEDLKPQFAIIRESAESLNLAILEKIGFEADDIIATIAKKSAAEGYEVLIVSSDKDLMQLVGERVFMYDAMKNKFIGITEVQEKFAVAPNQVLDMLSLVGDASDNIPGVKGIGPKTAAELIQQFGNLENIFANLHQIKQEKRRQLLSDGTEKAKLSKILATLREDVELGLALDDLKIKALDPQKLISFLEAQGFNSLVARVKKEFGISLGDKISGQKTTDKTPPSEIKFSEIKLTEISSVKTTRPLSKPAFSEEVEGGAQRRSGVYKDIHGASSSAPTEQSPLKVGFGNGSIDRLNKEAALNGIVTINRDGDFFTISTCKIGESLREIFYFSAKKAAPKIEAFDLFSFGEETTKVDVAISHPEPVEGCGNSCFDKLSMTQYSGSVNCFEILEKILLNDSIKKIFFDAKDFLRNRLASRCGEVDSLVGENRSGGVFKHTLSRGSAADHAKRPSQLEDARQFLKTAKIKSYEDLSLISHLLNSSTKNSLEELIKLNLDEEPEHYHNNPILQQAFKNFAIHQLYKIFSPKIFEQKLSESYLAYERPLLEVLAQMEFAGIKIDSKKLHALSAEFGEKIGQLSAEIHALAGCEFNIASPQQLAEVLFEKLGLTSSKKSKKTGAFSTGVEVLSELACAGHTIANKILDFRKFSKLKSTYADALPKEINPETGRIHGHFSTISTITGRLSSSHPNLQNIPIKSPEGRKIRQSFIAEKDHFLISADYSQIELRVLAHLAQIENLILAFKENKDIHRITAAQVFKLSEAEIDDSLRERAKAINFGIIYGISAFGLARQLDISRQEASTYIKSYLETYPGIDSSMKNYIALARQNSYVQTLSGRKCFIRGIDDKNPLIRAEAERLAINAPIQGSAADIIKKAMLALSKKFQAEKLRSRIILQIHDELIVEAPRDEVEIAAKILKSEMEGAAILDLPLKVDVKIAECWE
jgi:DNA polymerase-1